MITDHVPLKHFHNTKKPGLRFNRLKAELCGYEFEIIYRPALRNCNADALIRNPVLRNGEDNPDCPQRPQRGIATKTTITNPNSEGSLGNPKKIPNQNLLSESDEREESEEDSEKEPRRRKYTKQAEKKTARKFPVCEKVSRSNIAKTEPVLS